MKHLAISFLLVLTLLGNDTNSWAKTKSENEPFSSQSSNSFDVLKVEILDELHLPRKKHTATVLQNHSVLLVGGIEGNTVYAQTEIYDPNTQKFTLGSSLHYGQASHTATRLQNGDVFIAGGFVAGVGAITSTEIYNTSSSTFTDTSGLNVARYDHVAVLLKSGKVLIMGGWAGGLSLTTSAEIYDPLTGVLSFTGNMQVPRPNATGTVLDNGKVLITGGNTLSYSGLATAELYDPATGIFTYTGSMSSQRRFHAATKLPDGRVLITGGNGYVPRSYIQDLRSMEIYDPSTGLFNALTTTLVFSRANHTASLLPSGNVLITGGGKPAEVIETSTFTSRQLDFQDSSFLASSHVAVTLDDESVLITGSPERMNSYEDPVGRGYLFSVMPSRAFLPICLGN